MIGSKRGFVKRMLVYCNDYMNLRSKGPMTGRHCRRHARRLKRGYAGRSDQWGRCVRCAMRGTRCPDWRKP